MSHIYYSFFMTHELCVIFTLPKEGYSFVAGDYSQLELRIIAGMSNDQRLIEAFRSGRDPFREVGRDWFSKKEISDEERNQVKRALYGKTKFEAK